MNADGTKSGFSIDITREVSKNLNIPVIASGGAGSMEHFWEVFAKQPAAQPWQQGFFIYGEISIPELKEYLSLRGINVRK